MANVKGQELNPSQNFECSSSMGKRLKTNKTFGSLLSHSKLENQKNTYSEIELRIGIYSAKSFLISYKYGCAFHIYQVTCLNYNFIVINFLLKNIIQFTYSSPSSLFSLLKILSIFEPTIFSAMRYNSVTFCKSQKIGLVIQGIE